MLKTLSSAEGEETSQPPTPRKVSVFGVVEFGAGGILLGLVVFIVALLALNYFNILSLSKMNPKLFSLLPHQQSASSPNTSVPAAPKLALLCPVPKEFCGNGKQIYEGGKFIGLGFTLPFGTKLYSALAGTIVFGGVQDVEKGISSHARIIIGQKEVNGYSAVYDYFGLPANDKYWDNPVLAAGVKDVLANQEIAGLYGGSFPNNPPYNGINFLFSVKDNLGKDIILTSEDFEKPVKQVK